MSEEAGRPLHWRLVLFAVLFAVVAWLCCTWGKGLFGMQPTMTGEQAIDRVEELIKDAAAQLPPASRLEYKSATDSFPCDDPTDLGPKGRIFVERDYWVRGLPPDHLDEHFHTLQRYWTDRGYEQTRFTTFPNLVGWKMVHTTPDGFRISLSTTGGGKSLYLRSQSPCVWPDGTPEPEF